MKTKRSPIQMTPGWKFLVKMTPVKVSTATSDCCIFSLTVSHVKVKS